MQIQENYVVAFHYTLRNSDGDELDSSRGRLPALYLHGHGNLVRGLERALSGRTVGDHFEVVVPPEQGYGLHDPELVQVLPREMIEQEAEIRLGVEFQAHTEDGLLPVRVVALSDETVTVDGNHEWAGEDLHFSIQIRHIRPATREELASGVADPDTVT